MNTNTLPLHQRLISEKAVGRFSHPLQPTLAFVPLSILFIYLSVHYSTSTLLQLISLPLIGLFSWTLVEYFLHRFIFHWTQVREPIKTLASGLHMAHHRDVNAPDLILAPPLVVVIFGAMICGLFYLMTQNWAHALLLESGLLIGYVLYEWTHFGSHKFPCTSKIGKYLKQYHLRHHYKEPNGAFGVTTPFWDYVFRTTPKR